MIGGLLHIPPQQNESTEDFVVRKRKVCTNLAAATGPWSKERAASVCKWKAHVLRAHDPGAWSNSILALNGADWLQAQRVANSQGEVLNRTRTRAVRGKPPKRWEEGSREAAAAQAAISSVRAQAHAAEGRRMLRSFAGY